MVRQGRTPGGQPERFRATGPNRPTMTVEVERTFEVDAPVEEVWALLSDPEYRARAVSVAESYDVDGDVTIWNISIPVPLVRGTVAVRTRDVERDPPRYVKFVGNSKVLTVTGEHELSATEGGTRVRNRFVVDGKLPGVEGFFERNVGKEFENIRLAVSNSVQSVDED